LYYFINVQVFFNFFAPVIILKIQLFSAAESHSKVWLLSHECTNINTPTLLFETKLQITPKSKNTA